METTIERLAAEAVAAIGRAPIAPDVRDRLVELARYVSDRKV
jgi:hypothetical protein